jgi:hypothetical protein
MQVRVPESLVSRNLFPRSLLLVPLPLLLVPCLSSTFYLHELTAKSNDKKYLQ